MCSWDMDRVGGAPEGWIGMVSTGGILEAITAKQNHKNCLDWHIPDLYHVRVPLPGCSGV